MAELCYRSVGPMPSFLVPQPSSDALLYPRNVPMLLANHNNLADNAALC